MKLWIVGKPTDTETGWEFQGVFSSEEGALAVCRGNPSFFIGPVMLDQAFPTESVPWPDAYIPAIDRPIEVS